MFVLGVACFKASFKMSVSSDSSEKKTASDRGGEDRRTSLSRHHRDSDPYIPHVSSSSSSAQRQPQRSPTLPLSVARQLHHSHGHGKEEPSSSESPSPERVAIAAGSGYHHGGKKRSGETGRERGKEGCLYDGHQPSSKRDSQGPSSHHHQGAALGLGWGEEVVLLVDRQTFPVNPRLFTRYPNTMLGRMFCSSMENQLTLKPNERGEYEVARGITASLFRAVLDYYHHGVISCPSSESVSELRETCDYLMIPFNEKTIKTQNISDLLNELSNDGARAQFEKYLQQNLLHAMVKCTQKGERECQIVILMEDDVIDWDDDYPPSVGEDHVERVTNSELCRFFKYFENRDIAKDTLREKGLKKIRIGIEGYPTTKEKVRVRAHTGRTEVVYNYIQRPFLRLSWEKDEAKSRHVDFTCVKIKTDIAPDAEAATLLSGNEDNNFDY